jgi:hypothetical protein
MPVRHAAVLLQHAFRVQSRRPPPFRRGHFRNESLEQLSGEPRRSRYRSRRRSSRRCSSRTGRSSRRYRSRAIVLVARVLRVAGTVVFAASTTALRPGVAVRVHVPVGVRVRARCCPSHRDPARRSGQCGRRHETHERLLHSITPIPSPYWVCVSCCRSNAREGSSVTGREAGTAIPARRCSEDASPGEKQKAPAFRRGRFRNDVVWSVTR